MTYNATGGATIVYGQQPPQSGTNYQAEYNPGAAPSVFYGGTGIVDMRWGYREYNNPVILGMQGATYIPVINQIPSTASTTIIAAAQAPTGGTALTLATQSATGMTVLSSALTVVPSLNSIAAGAIALDGVPGTISFLTGQQTVSTTGGINFYDPTKALARNVRITTNASDTGSYKVSGADIYGFAMTETISGTTVSTGATLSGKKAFKFITQVLPSATGIGSTSVSVGTGDVIGLPLRADGFGDVDISYNAFITSSTGFTAAVTTAATSTSGDVRGTYALQTASNGVLPLQIFVTPRLANLTSSTGLFGVAQA